MENISVFDLVVTILLATATFWGGMRGVVSQISAIATWVLSGMAAARYGSVVGEIVSIPEPWRAPVSALIVFCASLLALSVASRFVKRAVSLAGLKEFDRQTGALFGLFKGCAICVVLTFFCVLASEKTRDLVDNSKSGPYLASVSLLLKGAFPESETMTRFEALVSTMKSTQARGNNVPTLKSEIADLETYLKTNVLSEEATDVVEEAESGAVENGGASSGWSRFLDDLRGWGRSNDRTASQEANASRTNASSDFDNWGNLGSSGDWGPANGASSERWNVDGASESGKNNGEWESWNVWGERERLEERENEEEWGNRGSWRENGVRGGSASGGYYDEYEEDFGRGTTYVGSGDYGWSEDDDYNGWEERGVYDGDLEGGSAETASDWSAFASFLTNITGETRSARGANAAVGASNGERTANYGAPSGESLNDFLGVPANSSATRRSATPTFDASAPRTTDGAILGRPSATATPLIPPLPY